MDLAYPNISIRHYYKHDHDRTDSFRLGSQNQSSKFAAATFAQRLLLCIPGSDTLRFLEGAANDVFLLGRDELLEMGAV